MRSGLMPDVVIAGAGAAGCVLARRLVDAGLEVCLVESGELRRRQSNVDLVGGFTNLWGSRFDWGLKTTPQKDLGGRTITINQGRIVGGSSAINAMMYVRCHPGDYEQLEKKGGAAWARPEIEQAFAGLENYLDGPAPGRYSSGLMAVRDCPDPASYSPEFQAAAMEIGYRGPDCDYNGADQIGGVGPLQFNIDAAGNRHSAFNAYLEPVLGAPNLTLRSGVTVERLVFDGDLKVVGLEVRDAEGNRETLRASREVVLAAGALQTPALLLRSGIGPVRPLERAGLKVKAGIKAVGANLMDHLQLPIVVRLARPLPEPTLLTGNVLFLDLHGNSPYGAPDLQLNFTPAAPRPLQRFLPNLGGPAMIFLPILVQPKSRGRISLVKDGQVHIDPHYLHHPDDLTVLSQAVDVVRSMTASSAMKGLASEELAPGATSLEEYIRGNVSTLWHPVGTCAMGHDPDDSVVNGKLQVHGIEGLRVCDASITPHATGGNNHVPTMVTAEICARLLLADSRSSQ